ncbi:DUF262 domain-containing protein [Actinomycetospora straminea]|uniref:DUF262 domain-containing protein n=1 Tax=Actinomycetospora straminea TaxID=663607 RepID=A0ABP9DYL0_9PSEU|nr:DUF262 domain-containing protein [Actinomycetospora straminea]MDD7932405.1 DUF262 domain-containing protein [Actinomycetospora straminea]
MELHHTVVELEVLLARIGRGELDPGWSDTGTWDTRRQQLLVDTVVRDWPIPPLVVAGGEEREVVLDGRERLRALWRFVQDDLPFAGRPTPGGEYLEQLDGMRHAQLPERFRRRLRRYGVPVLRVPAADDAEVRELMSRWGAARPMTATRPTGPETPAEPEVRPRPAPRPEVVVPPPPPSGEISTVPPPPPPREAPPREAPGPVVPEPTAAFDQPTIPEQPVARPRAQAPLFDGGPAAAPPDRAPDREHGAHRRPADDEPIFDELSAWFLDVDAAPAQDDPAWTSPADRGYDAARSALHAPTPDLTAAGLPIREPAARLAPGTIRPPARARPPRPADPRLVGDHLARLRDGTAAARQDLAGGAVSGY